AEANELLIEKYFEEGDLNNDEIRDGMRMAARDHELRTVPVFVASGTANIGTYPLMEAFRVYISPPTLRRVGVHPEDDPETINYINKPQTDDKPLAAYVFKSINDKYVGSLTFLRVFAGSVSTDSKVHNSTRETEERFGQLMSMRGKDHDSVEMLHAGDIGVVAKLQDTHTGDTLTDGETHTIVKPDFPAPTYMVAVEPRSQSDNAKMGQVLNDICDADPTLQWRHDPTTSEVILEGMGEIHVELAIAIAERMGSGLDTRVPKVPYKEAIMGTASQTYRHKKQTGGAGQFGEVSLRVEPNPGGGFAFDSEIRGGAISAVFLPSIEKGVQSVLGEGVLAGYTIEDVRVVVFDGKEHPVDSKDIAFQIAGREAFKQAFMAASPVLMEPVYDVEVIVPADMMGDIMGNLNGRRGRVQGIDNVGIKSVINAQVPLAEMLRFGNDLRSLTGGRGIFRMSFSHYEQLPAHLTADVVAGAGEAVG
ncbi:MAG: EF-Tu/IF-2/RF-3 family GTPase, partial [Chloroflexota bacterium]